MSNAGVHNNPNLELIRVENSFLSRCANFKKGLFIIAAADAAAAAAAAAATATHIRRDGATLLRDQTFRPIPGICPQKSLLWTSPWLGFRVIGLLFRITVGVIDNLYLPPMVT